MGQHGAIWAHRQASGKRSPTRVLPLVHVGFHIGSRTEGDVARASAAQWAKRVEQWKDSGLTAKEFAADTGIKASTLTYWKWRLGATASLNPPSERSTTSKRRGHARASRQRAARAVGAQHIPLVEVPIESVSPPARAAESLMLELVIGGTMTVRVPRDFDEATLRRVVRALS
jgi:hypothetical protein